MKLNANDLINTPLLASDSEKIGKIKDILFDDREWKVRYIVVDTGGWLKDRRVLVLPDQLLLTARNLKEGKIPCTTTKDAIEGCPPLDAAAPVSRRYEMEHAAYYKASPYWLGSATWGVGAAANLVPPSPEEEAKHDQAMEEIEQCHVRSAVEIEGYEVLDSRNVSIGEVEQLEIDWPMRTILNIVTKEGGLLTTKQERDIDPKYVREIHWNDQKLVLSMPYVKGEDETSDSLAGTGLAAPQF